MTTTPGPRHGAIPCYCPVHLEAEAEARADVDGLVALDDELRKAVEAFVDAWEEQRRWKEDAEFPTDEYRALLALLAGDKAEAPE